MWVCWKIEAAYVRCQLVWNRKCQRNYRIHPPSHYRTLGVSTLVILDVSNNAFIVFETSLPDEWTIAENPQHHCRKCVGWGTTKRGCEYWSYDFSSIDWLEARQFHRVHSRTRSLAKFLEKSWSPNSDNLNANEFYKPPILKRSSNEESSAWPRWLVCISALRSWKRPNICGPSESSENQTEFIVSQPSKKQEGWTTYGYERRGRIKL